MSNREEIERIIGLYVEGINGNDVENIPLTADVEFHGSMLPEPKKGEAAVREHLAQTAPFLTMQVKHLIVENDTAAAMIEMEAVNGVTVEGAAFFRFREGKICFDQGFFDTHRLITGKR